MPRYKRPLEQPPDGGGATAPSPSKRNKSDSKGPYFVCHYYARSPLESQFHKCRPRTGEGDGRTTFKFRRYGDLLQHHRREHLLPSHCPRCWMVFKQADQEQDHARAPNRCDLVPSAPFVGVSLNQLQAMAQGSKMSLEQRWRRDWTIIFPGIGEDQCLRGPYAIINEDSIDIITERIFQLQSVRPDLCAATLDAVRQMFGGQRLVAARSPVFLGPAVAGPTADVEPLMSDEFLHDYGEYLGETGQSSGNAGQDLPIPIRGLGVSPADLPPSNPDIARESPRQDSTTGTSTLNKN